MRLTSSLICALFAAMPLKAEPFDTFRDCDVCPEMIALPMGEFMMGAPLGELQQGFEWHDGQWRLSQTEEPFYNFRDQPIHPVTIDIPFAMGRNEVTYDEWMACVNDGGCNGFIPDTEIFLRTANNDVVSFSPKGSYPLLLISYLDALTYVDWLSQKTGMRYRLPTEAEWEYAARAGTQTPFAQGMDVTKDQVNFWDEIWTRAQINGDPQQILGVYPVRVEELDAANGWGLRHMSGNISELTMSCETDQHELWSLSSQYLERAEAGGRCDRVSRGGGYVFVKAFVRVGFRVPVDDDARLQSVGFRVLRETNTLLN